MARRREATTIHGTEWVAGQGVLHIGDNEFLVLLLMVEPNDERIGNLFEQGAVGRLEESLHALVYVLAISVQFGNGRPG